MLLSPYVSFLLSPLFPFVFTPAARPTASAAAAAAPASAAGLSLLVVQEEEGGLY